MSDADALWLSDPMDAFSKDETAGSSVVVSRGRNPHRMFVRWGFTVCMGFVLFRGTSEERVALRKFLETMQTLVEDSGDDQTAINQALDVLGVTWLESSDLRFLESTQMARGVIRFPEKLSITALPHNVIMRYCARPQHISSHTVVAHCHNREKGDVMSKWMEDFGLWFLDGDLVS